MSSLFWKLDNGSLLERSASGTEFQTAGQQTEKGREPAQTERVLGTSR